MVLQSVVGGEYQDLFSPSYSLPFIKWKGLTLGPNSSEGLRKSPLFIIN